MSNEINIKNVLRNSAQNLTKISVESNEQKEDKSLLDLFNFKKGLEIKPTADFKGILKVADIDLKDVEEFFNPENIEKAIDYTEVKISDFAQDMTRQYEYGKEFDDLSKGEQEDFEKAKRTESLKMEFVKSNAKELEEGVVQRTYGNWLETTIELYDGKTYSELSKEEKAKVDEWKSQCEEITKNQSLLYSIKYESNLPECPLEQSSEVRIQKKTKTNI